MQTNTFSGAIQAPAVIDTPATRLFRGGGEFLGPYALVPASIAGMDLRGAVKLLLLASHPRESVASSPGDSLQGERPRAPPACTELN